MHRLMHKFGSIIGTVIVVLFIATLSVQAAPIPHGWPWHGVSIDNTDFDPQQLPEIVAHIHINSVQLRLKPRKLAKEDGIPEKQAWEETLTWGDRMLDQCKRLGLTAIISLEGFPLNPHIPYNDTSPNFWRSGKDINELVALAGELAKHFAKRGKELAAYEVLSEPVMRLDGRSVAPTNWPSLETRIIDNIRKYDPQRWIAVAPPPWGNPRAYNGFHPLPYTHIVYGSHMYFPHAFTHQGISVYNNAYAYPGEIDGRYWDRDTLKKAIQPLRRFQLRYQVPVWIGEFSAIHWAPGGEQYIRDLASIFNEYGWSWTYFSLDGYFGWNPDYDDTKPVPMDTWRSHRVGYSSARWKTLEAIFNGLNH